MNVVRSVRDHHSPLATLALNSSLTETSLDSLDLLRLWCELETVTGRELTQQKFHPRTTLQQIFQMVNQ